MQTKPHKTKKQSKTNKQTNKIKTKIGTVENDKQLASCLIIMDFFFL